MKTWSPTRRSPSVLSVLFVLTLGLGVASAETTPPPPAEHPLAAAIEELRDSTRERLEELEARRKAAHSAAAQLAVGREIARVKFDFELGVLRLQLGEEQALGRTDSVDELVGAIDALERLRAEVADPSGDERVPTERGSGEAQ